MARSLQQVSKQAPFGPAADSEPSFDGAPDPGQETLFLMLMVAAQLAPMLVYLHVVSGMAVYCKLEHFVSYHTLFCHQLAQVSVSNHTFCAACASEHFARAPSPTMIIIDV
eukprot:999279-Amphidinium_carterae.1